MVEARRVLWAGGVGERAEGAEGAKEVTERPSVWEEEGTGEWKGDAARGVEQEWCRAAGERAGDGEGAVSSQSSRERLMVGLVVEREGVDSGADASEPPLMAEPPSQARANDGGGVGSPDPGQGRGQEASGEVRGEEPVVPWSITGYAPAFVFMLCKDL